MSDKTKSVFAKFIAFISGMKSKKFFAIVLCDGVRFFLSSDIFTSKKEADDRGKEIERGSRSMYYIKTIKFKHREDLGKTLDSIKRNG